MGPKERKATSSKERPLQHRQIPQHEPQKHLVPSSPREGRSRQDVVQSTLKAIELLVLAAAYSPISQLTLSPVYGSIPSSLQHQRLTVVVVLLAWSLKSKIHASILWNMVAFLPVLAFSIPLIQVFLFRFSSHLGAVYGPLVTELLTYGPLVFASVLGSAELFDALDLSRYGEYVVNAGPALISYIILSVANKVSVSLIEKNIGSGIVFTRIGLQLIISSFYAILLPSKFLLIACLPLLHTFTLNVHAPFEQTTALLNTSLRAHEYSLVARQESITGYISVLDNMQEGFRVMRCDHSLLGGEWFQRKPSMSKLKEPIYSVFSMLEAVRLVETESAGMQVVRPDKEKHALVIGLGIGTTPAALIAHGINTTIIEIDPVVYEYAIRYFNLPLNHTAVVEDATNFVAKQEVDSAERKTYDYIIHDVFTGGAEPVDLFTEEFLKGLSSLLNAQGIIAINYAGDLLLPSASIVVYTIKSVFPTCRIYRENAAPTDSSKKDFTNMVMFCRKSKEAFNFRRPVQADFLGSEARKHYLYPRYEVNSEIFKNRAADGELEVLKRGRTKNLELFHKTSAVGHWGIMRTVLPNVIWENW